MLDIGKDSSPSPKCYFTHVNLPQYINDKQPPTKRKPFSCALQRPFVHSIEFLISKSAVSFLSAHLWKATGFVRHARVHMKLKDLLEDDFFNGYIKTGNIALLSEGKRGIENVFSLHDGVLRLEVDRPTYERAGLPGKPIESPGRKHAKSRYVVELNLRLPSMVRGRKLYNRMVYAFDHALIDTVTWLFFDLRDPTLGLEKRTLEPFAAATSAAATVTTAPNEPRPDTAQPMPRPVAVPLPAHAQRTDAKVTAANSPVPPGSPVAKHHPIVRHMTQEIPFLDSVITPAFPVALDQDSEETAIDFLEWLCFAMMECPRVRKEDKVDATISRYSVPDLSAESEDVLQRSGTNAASGRQARGDDSVVLTSTDAEENGKTSLPSVQDLAVIRYHGFMPGELASKMLIAAVRATDKAGSWFAMRIQSLRADDCVFFVRDGTAMIWEYS